MVSLISTEKGIILIDRWVSKLILEGWNPEKFDGHLVRQKFMLMINVEGGLRWGQLRDVDIFPEHIDSTTNIL